ncbi:MAG: trypsin-like peptidase domain-containing protein [Bacilli bacterium]|nr:trypsin-like peptidase domain-containing protein [Bacilli bacterium]
MYKKAIKDNSKMLIPFLQGIKNKDSEEIISNVGTLLIINEKTLLTCKHIAESIVKQESVINWFFKIEKDTKIEIIVHPVLDIAIIKFDKKVFNIKKKAVFSDKLPEQGQSICKLGYAFPNVDIFEQVDDEIKIKENGNLELPLFPLDGIVTRHINLVFEDKIYKDSLFETSTPGLRGQSGGPVFSPEGIIYGIQSATSHIDLNFDVESKLNKTNIPQPQFINLGIVVSSKEIIKFLESKNIEVSKYRKS